MEVHVDKWPVAGSGALITKVLGAQCAGISSFEGGPITTITATIVWPKAKPQGGNTAPPISRKLD